MCDNSVLYAKQFRHAVDGEALNVTMLTVPGVQRPMAGFLGASRTASSVHHTPMTITTCLTCVKHGCFLTISVPSGFAAAHHLSGQRLVAKFEQRHFEADSKGGVVPEDRFRFYHGDGETFVALHKLAEAGATAIHHGTARPKPETFVGALTRKIASHKGVPANALVTAGGIVLAPQNNNAHVPQRRRHNPNATVFAGVLNAARSAPRQPAVTTILLMAALAASRIIV